MEGDTKKNGGGLRGVEPTPGNGSFNVLKKKSVLCVVCDVTKGLFQELGILAKNLVSGASQERKGCSLIPGGTQQRVHKEWSSGQKFLLYLYSY